MCTFIINCEFITQETGLHFTENRFAKTQNPPPRQ